MVKIYICQFFLKYPDKYYFFRRDWDYLSISGPSE